MVKIKVHSITPSTTGTRTTLSKPRHYWINPDRVDFIVESDRGSGCEVFLVSGLRLETYQKPDDLSEELERVSRYRNGANTEVWL